MEQIEDLRIAFANWATARTPTVRLKEPSSSPIETPKPYQSATIDSWQYPLLLPFLAAASANASLAVPVSSFFSQWLLCWSCA
jgi:hypothetical protein